MHIRILTAFNLLSHKQTHAQHATADVVNQGDVRQASIRHCLRYAVYQHCETRLGNQLEMRATTICRFVLLSNLIHSPPGESINTSFSLSNLSRLLSTYPTSSDLPAQSTLNNFDANDQTLKRVRMPVAAFGCLAGGFTLYILRL